ncbi:hypothetical protein [Vibrio navarrensis]|uniref:hypothetical protein n=1 Tax=Vibrio navarrensis TaxID=29495 RepID=UPI0012ADAAEC|nr:hypothetical protein [Vibrio navarrensis]
MKNVFDHSAHFSAVDRNQVCSSRINDSDTKEETITATNLKLSGSIMSNAKLNKKLVTKTTLKLDIIDTDITHKNDGIITKR